MRVLVVDDSRTTRMILRQILRDLGFEVSEASNGQEGLDQLARIQPELVLVDWNMPVLSGLELVRAVRANPAYQDVRLVMVTTETEMAQIAVALDAGANEYILKPFTREALGEKLQLLGVALR